MAAVQAEEAGEKHRAIALYEQMLRIDPDYAPGYINLGTIHFHLRQFVRAEELYRQATMKDPDMCWRSLTWATYWTNWSGPTSRLQPISGRSRWHPGTRMRITTWPWPSNARANSGRPCATGRPT